MCRRLCTVLLCLAVTLCGIVTVEAEQLESNCLICCPDEVSTKDITVQNPPVKGDEVLELQRALKYLKFYNGKLDGIYSYSTSEAVRSFQRSSKIPVNGNIDNMTRTTLKKFFEITPTTKNNRAPEGPVRLVIDSAQRKLTVYEGDKPFKSYAVAVGKGKTPTPIGEWEISRKAKNWGTGFGTRWMGLNVPWGIFGIHGTNKPWSIGTEASGGCVRMFNSDVEELFEWVKPGTRVTVLGQIYKVRYEDRLVLRRGYKGADVYQVQIKLKEIGYLKVEPDGIYGPTTIEAVKKFQKDHGFPETGELDIDVYPAIGL